MEPGCRPHHPPFAAQSRLPDGRFITVSPDPEPENPFRDPESGTHLSVILVFGPEPENNPGAPHNHRDLNGFLDWAGRQEPPDRPVCIEPVQASPGRTAVAYTTGRRIQRDVWFEEAETRVLRKIVREEADEFELLAQGEIYQAELRNACGGCGQPAPGPPAGIERGLEGPPERALRTMRKLLEEP